MPGSIWATSTQTSTAAETGEENVLFLEKMPFI